MMTLRPSTDSSRLARSILEAWSGGDGRRVQSELDRATAFCGVSASLAALEAERRELLETLARELRSAGHRNTEVTAVCLNLLRHLTTSS